MERKEALLSILMPTYNRVNFAKTQLDFILRECAEEREKIEIVPLYFAKVRPVIYRDGNILMVDDERMRMFPGEEILYRSVRFRTLGCYPLTGGIESDANTLEAIVEETLKAVTSERTSRVIDHEASGSMERRKREGYF